MNFLKILISEQLHFKEADYNVKVLKKYQVPLNTLIVIKILMLKK